MRGLALFVAGTLAGNDTPVAGEANTWSVSTGPAHVGVTVNAAGTYIYTPVPGFIAFAAESMDASAATAAGPPRPPPAPPAPMPPPAPAPAAAAAAAPRPCAGAVESFHARRAGAVATSEATGDRLGAARLECGGSGSELDDLEVRVVGNR